MDFGLFMMPLHPPRRSFADSYDRDITLLVQADQLGYHEAWIGEHITETWENAPVPELLIANALARTERIIFATGVTMLPLHHPVDTAHRIAMLDHMARGRFYWGIGVRSLATDLHLYGVKYHSMDEVRERGRRPWRSSSACGRQRTDTSASTGSTIRCMPRRWTRHSGAGYTISPTRSPIRPSGLPRRRRLRTAFAWLESGLIPMTNLMAPHVRLSGKRWQKVQPAPAG